MVDSDKMTFVLARGGHNAGIVSNFKQKGHHYRIYEWRKEEPYLGADHWFDIAKVEKGSWWQAWHKWLVQQSSVKRVIAHALAPGLPAAPRAYVLQK